MIFILCKCRSEFLGLLSNLTCAIVIESSRLHESLRRSPLRGLLLAPEALIGLESPVLANQCLKTIREPWSGPRSGPRRSIPYPGGSIQSPGGSIPSPGGSIPSPGGSIQSLGGSIPGLGGSIPNLGGSIPSLGGSIPSLGGSIPSLGGSIPNPGGG